MHFLIKIRVAPQYLGLVGTIFKNKKLKSDFHPGHTRNAFERNLAHIYCSYHIYRWYFIHKNQRIETVEKVEQFLLRMQGQLNFNIKDSSKTEYHMIITFMFDLEYC